VNPIFHATFSEKKLLSNLTYPFPNFWEKCFWENGFGTSLFYQLQEKLEAPTAILLL